ncbi:hypothetical protein [Acidaminobacter hydrogenoformans]|uniref:Uncharacterized protein n=1 Tax=Acidaminobacter hydrogenoformans DSM 2784 TaxID=1120920 RepID=A0A1G5S2F5_9FIRM|nr:hypothetical protein [Acidaminobacter hydrogenoformans]SCZ80486.1 hypothetical protein SAMN03080599_02295 [Acidaminobacter hydrogenoformans DSM 2784]
MELKHKNGFGAKVNIALIIGFCIILFGVCNWDDTINLFDYILKSRILLKVFISFTILSLLVHLYINGRLQKKDNFYICADFITYGLTFYTFHNLLYISFLHAFKNSSIFKGFGLVDIYLLLVASVLMFFKPVPGLIDSWRTTTEYFNAKDIIPVVDENI